jgi:hypothetical protein
MPQKEQRAGGAGHVVTEHSEWMGQGMAAAAVAKNAGHTDDHRCDQEDEPEDYDHDARRGFRCRPTAEKLGWPPGLRR